MTPEVHFNYGLDSTSKDGIYGPGFKISFDTYGRCISNYDTTPNPSFLSFIVPAGINATANSITQCQINFHDDQKRVYTFKIKADPTLFPQKVEGQNPPWPTGDQVKNGINPLFIDCSGNPPNSDQMDWCQAIYVFQDKDLTNPHLPNAYHVQMQGPASCNRNPAACPGLGPK